MKKYDVSGIIDSLEKIEYEAILLHESLFEHDLDEQGDRLSCFFFGIAENAVDFYIWVRMMNHRHGPEFYPKLNHHLLLYEKKFSYIIMKFKSASLDFGKIVNIKKLVDAIEDYRLTWQSL